MYQVSWVGEGGRPRTYHAFAFERRLAYCHAFMHERWPVYYHAFAFEHSSATPWGDGRPLLDILTVPGGPKAPYYLLLK